MTRGGGRQPDHGGGPDRLACRAHAFAWRELCRAACGRWGAGAAFALQNGDSGAPGTRQSQGVNRPGLVRSELFPVFPVKNDLFPVKVRTIFFNDDKVLGHFPGFVLSVPAFFERHPEADPAKAYAQTPRRAAALALAGMVRAVKGAGAPPRHGSFSGVSGYGSFAARARARW